MARIGEPLVAGAHTTSQGEDRHRALPAYRGPRGAIPLSLALVALGGTPTQPVAQRLRWRSLEALGSPRLCRFARSRGERRANVEDGSRFGQVANGARDWRDDLLLPGIGHVPGTVNRGALARSEMDDA